MDAKERLSRLEEQQYTGHTLSDRAKIQALIEIREALDKQTMALDRLTEEVKAGRNRSI